MAFWSSKFKNSMGNRTKDTAALPGPEADSTATGAASAAPEAAPERGARVAALKQLGTAKQLPGWLQQAGGAMANAKQRATNPLDTSRYRLQALKNRYFS